MKDTRNLLIAEFLIRLQSDMTLFLDEAYHPFATTDERTVPDIEITCFPDLPVNLFLNTQTLFEASDKEKILYRVFRYQDNGLGLFLYKQQVEEGKSGHESNGIKTTPAIQQILLLDKARKIGTVYTEPRSDGQLDVMKYPLGPILLYYLTAWNNAILIHASGIFDGKKGRLFTGFSGYGKSTMAGLWQTTGSQIINDDRLIIRKKNNGSYVMYNTPMYYRDEPKSAPLNSIHLIYHAPVNELERVKGAAAVSNVMAFCIQNNYDTSLIHNNLLFITGMTRLIPVIKTGFIPDQSIISLITAYEY